MGSFAKENPPKMAKSLVSFIDIGHALVANFIVTNMYFDAIWENKILAKFSEFTVCKPISNLFSVFIPLSCQDICLENLVCVLCLLHIFICTLENVYH